MLSVMIKLKFSQKNQHITQNLQEVKGYRKSTNTGSICIILTSSSKKNS